MKKLLESAILIFFFCACTGHGRYNTMRQGLDSINRLNRTDKPFKPGDVQSYVSYFDSYGASNDRMLAYYLLGRAYHEQGEAPMALQCYHEAITAADVNSSKCDYAQLSRVYGQTCELFYHQSLYQEELQCRDSAIKYAWLGKDTLAALLNYEQKVYSYKCLQNDDSVVSVSERVACLYRQYGYPDYAASILGTSLRPLIEKGNYKKAKQYIDIYETESGFFDPEHNIESGREIYYNLKAYYYLGIGMTDSANYYFRKELQLGKDLNNQNAGTMGLAETYKKLNMSDSVAKYAMISYRLNDSLYMQRNTVDIAKIQSIYKYSRLHEKAIAESQKAARRSVVIWVCVSFITILLFLIYVITAKLLNKQREVERQYFCNLEIIRQAKDDIKKLCVYKEVNKALIAEKEAIISHQVNLQQNMLEEENHLHHYADKSIKLTEVYHDFEMMSVVGNSPSSADWQQLQDTFDAFYPGFVCFLKKHHHLLNDKAYKTILLIRLKFKPKVISSMLEVSPSYISKIRVEMLSSLFGIKGKAIQFDQLVQKIY